MRARKWVGGLSCLVLGAGLGATAMYGWLRPPGQVVAEPAAPATPSEADGRARLRAMLAVIGGEVIDFRRTDERRSTIRWAAADGGFQTLDRPYEAYRMAFEADVTFARDCQIVEGLTLMWSDGNQAVGDLPHVVTGRVKHFRKGERRSVRGLLQYHLENGEWEAARDDRIVVAEGPPPG